MDTNVIDAQLTTQLALVNGGISYEDPQGFLEARIALGGAIGILSIIAPEENHAAFQRALMTVETPDEFWSLKDAVFSIAFARLNHMNSQS